MGCPQSIKHYRMCLMDERVTWSKPRKSLPSQIPQVQIIAIDVGTVSKSKKALERAQVLCLVVSAELGVEAQTRDCIAMAAKYNVKNV